MTSIATFQRLERNSDPTFCEHPPSAFCINCLIYELLARRDSRYDVAGIALVDLRRLARLRALAKGGTSWQDCWHDILDPDRLDADLSSNDSARRAAAEAAQQSFGDFLAYRDGVNKRVTPAHRKYLREIEQRVRRRHAEIERDGIEPDIGYLEHN